MGLISGKAFQPENADKDVPVRMRARFLMLIAMVLLLTGLAAALLLVNNLDKKSYDPLAGVWKSVDGKTTVEFSSDKTLVEKTVGLSGSKTYQVKVVDSNTLRLTGADGSARQVDWLITENQVLVLVSGTTAVTYQR